jgi:ribulose-5-phosphate 4-epimerase/fuculose-1-phosphate aldolase
VTAAEELALATRVLAKYDLIGMYGHVSVLPDPDADRYLLSPGAGFRKEICRAEDVVSLRYDDEFVPGLPLELYMHSELHRAHPQIGALVHTHAPALTELSLYPDIPGEALLLHATFWPEKPPVYERAGLVVTREQAAELVALMGTASVTLLRWHGAMVSGRSLAEAVFRAIYAERNAQLLLHRLRATAAPIPVPHHDRDQVAQRVITDRMLGLVWDYESADDPLQD